MNGITEIDWNEKRRPMRPDESIPPNSLLAHSPIQLHHTPRNHPVVSLGSTMARPQRRLSMRYVHVFLLFALIPCLASAETQWPGPVENGYLLPNGWRITPIGTALPTHDLILNLQPSPDGKVMVALTCGFNPHELVVIDTQTDLTLQHIPVKTAWFGLAWEPGGKRIFVSGGNDKKKEAPAAPIYIYGYENGKLSEQPVGTLSEDLPKEKVFWAGLAMHPTQPLLYAANRATNEIVVFDTATGEKKGKVSTEQQPNDAVLSPDGKMLYVSNWGSDTVSFINTETLQVKSTVKVGDNPNDMLLAPDGRLYVCCSNDNSVVVIDTAKCRPTETILTSLHERAPEGSTPNALAMDPAAPNTLYVANADNYNVCVIQVEEPGESAVLGFIPTGWYPSALAVGSGGGSLHRQWQGSGLLLQCRWPPQPQGRSERENYLH